MQKRTLLHLVIIYLICIDMIVYYLNGIGHVAMRVVLTPYFSNFKKSFTCSFRMSLMMSVIALDFTLPLGD